MKYVIEKKQDNMKLMYYNVNMIGLDVIPKNSSNISIKIKKIVLIDSNLRDVYIKEKINRKIDKVIKFMLRILNDEGTTDEDSGMVLDELNRLKGIVIKKYREYMIESEYKALLTKLFLIEEEFKKNYNQKMYMSFMNNNYYVEESLGGRGR